jgi:hypothetical protein
MTICSFLRKYLARNLLYLIFMLMIKYHQDSWRAYEILSFITKYVLKEYFVNHETYIQKVLKWSATYPNFCKITDINKCHFRVRINDEELIGHEVPHFSSVWGQIHIDLLFVVNMSSNIYFVILNMQVIFNAHRDLWDKLQ